MDGKLFFKIPNDPEIMAKLVEAIPSNWLWVDGSLRAPRILVDAGQVEENTGFAIARFHDINPTIVAGYDDVNHRKIRTPNLFAIMVEGKLPGFVSFNEAGVDHDFVTLELAKKIAIGFISKGYLGWLNFYRDFHHNSKYDNSAQCSMALNSWHGPPVMKEEAGLQPARIKLEWSNSYDGQEDIEPIAAMCRGLNLREYMPEPLAETNAYKYN